MVQYELQMKKLAEEAQMEQAEQARREAERLAEARER